ncbi:Heat-labile enterotoxin alpha chain, partial [Enterococcus faecalis 06-MB-DW-09]
MVKDVKLMYKENNYYMHNLKKIVRNGGSNLDNTNGINAAVVRLFSDLTLLIVHQFIRSTWSPRASEPEPVWRSNIGGADIRERLFRYDDRGPDEIFRHGFAPRLNPNSASQFTWDLHDHVAGGDNPRSVYVSTTRTLISSDGEIEVWQPDVPLDQDIDIQYVYEIFAPGGIDVNASYGSNSPFVDENEIAFPGGIRPEYIRSVRHVAYERSSNNQIPRLLQITMNPFFLGEPDLPDVIIPTNTKIVMWDNGSSQKENNELIKVNDSYTDFMKRPGSIKPDPFRNDPNHHRRLADGEYVIKTSRNENFVID